MRLCLNPGAVSKVQGAVSNVQCTGSSEQCALRSEQSTVCSNFHMVECEMFCPGFLALPGLKEPTLTAGQW